jgi:hypothetical protein
MHERMRAEKRHWRQDKMGMHDRIQEQDSD